MFRSVVFPKSSRSVFPLRDGFLAKLVVGVAGLLGCIPETWLRRVAVAAAKVDSWANRSIIMPGLYPAVMVCRSLVAL